jgi:hypothetical protein
MTVKTNNEGEFKQNITIKCGHNATNILNVKFIIVQIFQLKASVRDKQHSPETVYYKTTINTYGLPIERISLMEYLELAEIKVEWFMCIKYFDGQKEFGGIPSSLEKSHKYMNKD